VENIIQFYVLLVEHYGYTLCLISSIDGIEKTMNNKILEILVIISGFIIMGLLTAQIYSSHMHGECIKQGMGSGYSSTDIIKLCEPK